MHELRRTFGIDERPGFPMPREDAASKIFDRQRAARLKVLGNLAGK